MKPVAGLLKNHGMKKKENLQADSVTLHEDETIQDTVLDSIFSLQTDGATAGGAVAENLLEKSPVAVKVTNHMEVTRMWKNAETVHTKETDVATADLVLARVRIFFDFYSFFNN